MFLFSQSDDLIIDNFELIYESSCVLKNHSFINNCSFTKSISFSKLSYNSSYKFLHQKFAFLFFIFMLI
ncbi:MAG: hypothetical protein Q8S84_05430 [bacterium]|nr:hypothetical protein [bacterium]